MYAHIDMYTFMYKYICILVNFGKRRINKGKCKFYLNLSVG